MSRRRQERKYKNGEKTKKESMYSTIANMATMVQQTMVNNSNNKCNDINMNDNDPLLEFIFSMFDEPSYGEVYQCYFTDGYLQHLRKVHNTLKNSGKYSQSEMWKRIVDTCRTIKKANKK